MRATAAQRGRAIRLSDRRPPLARHVVVMAAHFMEALPSLRRGGPMGAAGLRGESLFRVVRLWRACGPLPQSVLVRATAMSPRADATAELATGSNRCIAVSRRCGVRFRPVIFVGATGGGKTRLAVLIEERLQLSAHRISAHRQLTLNPSVPKIGESHALAGPRVGYASAGEDLGCRGAHPWKSDAAV